MIHPLLNECQIFFEFLRITSSIYAYESEEIKQSFLETVKASFLGWSWLSIGVLTGQPRVTVTAAVTTKQWSRPVEIWTSTGIRAFLNSYFYCFLFPVHAETTDIASQWWQIYSWKYIAMQSVWHQKSSSRSDNFTLDPPLWKLLARRHAGVITIL